MQREQRPMENGKLSTDHHNQWPEKPPEFKEMSINYFN